MPAAYTYDHDALTTDAAKVKLYSRQTGTTAATRDFSDQEIDAVLLEQTINTQRAKNYAAASELVELKILDYASVGKGLDTRKLSKLSITYGGRSTKLENLENLAAKLRQRAAYFSRNKNRTAKVINASGIR
jgi:hypothetical protein